MQFSSAVSAVVNSSHPSEEDLDRQRRTQQQLDDLTAQLQALTEVSSPHKIQSKQNDYCTNHVGGMW